MVLIEMVFRFCRKCNAQKIHELWMNPNSGDKKYVCITCNEETS